MLHCWEERADLFLSSPSPSLGLNSYVKELQLLPHVLSLSTTSTSSPHCNHACGPRIQVSLDALPHTLGVSEKPQPPLTPRHGAYWCALRFFCVSSLLSHHLTKLHKREGNKTNRRWVQDAASINTGKGDKMNSRDIWQWADSIQRLVPREQQGTSWSAPDICVLGRRLECFIIKTGQSELGVLNKVLIKNGLLAFSVNVQYGSQMGFYI